MNPVVKRMMFEKRLKQRFQVICPKGEVTPSQKPLSPFQIPSLPHSVLLHQNRSDESTSRNVDLRLGSDSSREVRGITNSGRLSSPRNAMNPGHLSSLRHLPRLQKQLRRGKVLLRT